MSVHDCLCVIVDLVGRTESVRVILIVIINHAIVKRNRTLYGRRKTSRVEPERFLLDFT